jgi:hypothetical protein
MDHERCDACGFDGARYDDAELLATLRDLGPRWRRLLAGTGAELRLRPEADVWSAIEYAAHSRDITALHAFGVEQALTVDEPSFPDIDGDALIESAAFNYGEADPDAVVATLEAEATRLAQLAGDAGRENWTRGLSVGTHRSDIRQLLEHALHDSLHHVADVERGLADLRRR